MKDEIRSFRDLECWKACRQLRIFIARKCVPHLPQDERYRLGDQMLRAARSTTANIAEGYGRFHYRDNAKFCSISRGSVHEVLDHLITAQDEGLISSELFADAEQRFEQAIKLLNGYIAYLQRAGKSTYAKESSEDYEVDDTNFITNNP